MASPRLLLVDDEPDPAFIVGRVARRANLDFTSCADARSGLEAIRQARPELILLDLNLPGMSGHELLAVVREDESLRDSNVALFCQSGLKRDIAAGWAAGADYLVCKDLLATPDALQRRLTEILHTLPDGRPLGSFLTCMVPSDVPVTWNAKGLLDSPFLLSAGRILSDEVLERVLRRALMHGFGTDAWLVPGTCQFASERIPDSVARNSASRLFVSLADQCWCLLGTESAAPLTVHLQQAHDRLIG